MMPDIYANYVTVSVSIYDFRLCFMRVNDSSANEPVAAIYVSPQHAKALATLLASQVEQYEACYGQIPVKPAEREA